ncbi:uncharacterized protein LOC124155859 isoform X2 [Ischnura elegans]|uniref:uncharacterized protein LOC124155859 isoform X2 n=1 Tax=Ischnura elegans TaxID=197161 RepID=UPI001ED8A9FE|nr:uncharacterized protein LOC124155859 isoform X2 [Ischnura elegans]
MEKMESSEMRNLMEIRDTQNSILTMQEALLEQMLPAPSSGSGTELVLDMVAPPVVSASQRAPSPSLAKFEAARSASISQYSSMIGLQSFGKSLNVSPSTFLKFEPHRGKLLELGSKKLKKTPKHGAMGPAVVARPVAIV